MGGGDKAPSSPSRSGSEKTTAEKDNEKALLADFDNFLDEGTTAHPDEAALSSAQSSASSTTIPTVNGIPSSTSPRTSRSPASRNASQSARAASRKTSPGRATAVSVGSIATPFSLLSEAFPTAPARAIRAALTDCGGDADAAATVLSATLTDEQLTGSNAGSTSGAGDSDAGTSSSAAPSRSSQLSQDEKIARLLQQAEINNANGNTESTEPQKPESGLWNAALERLGKLGSMMPALDPTASSSTEDDDEYRGATAFARHRERLAANAATAAQSGETGNGTLSPSAHRRQRRVGTHTVMNPRRPLDGPALTPSARKEVLSGLQNVIVPSLRAHFDELTFGDYHVSNQSYNFSLQEVAVAALALREDAIHVRAVSGGFRVNVLNVFLDLEIGQWMYQSHALFGIKDSGRARVLVNGLTASAILVPRASTETSVGVEVGDVEVVTEGTLRLRLYGTSADWAYNAAVVLLKPLVASYVNDAVRRVVETTLVAQLDGWNAWNEQPKPALANGKGHSSADANGQRSETDAESHSATSPNGEGSTSPASTS